MKILNTLLHILILSTSVSIASEKADVVVAQDGSGDFTTLTEAIENLPYYSYQRVVIFVKNGVYTEKIRLEQDFITIRGESRDSTIIEYAQLREDWQKNKDFIGPAVINIHADDIILDNLSIRNTQPEVGPHAFTILGTGTRTIITNCNVTSKGGDTVSLWNFKNGMYYHDNCYFEGAVDFVCPRGWCYISNSTFHELKNTAAVWHAAPYNESQKFIMENCTFLGTDSFNLARHHYDAQFYFLDCNFPSGMRNMPIEHVTYRNNPQRTRPYLYGDRYYFENCHREGGDFPWFADNLSTTEVKRSDINPAWTFDQQWNPIDSSKLEITKIESHDNKLYLWFNETVHPVGDLVIRLSTGKELKYYKGVGWPRLEFLADHPISNEDLKGTVTLVSGNVGSNLATVKTRYLK